MIDLITMAKDAGRAGKHWSDWTYELDAGIHELAGAVDFDAVEKAFNEGRRDWLLANWKSVWTTAPADYDSFGTTTVEEAGSFHGKALRRVIIEPAHYVYQTSRYGSGLHPSWDEDPRIEEAKAKERQAKLDADRKVDEARREAGLAWLKTATEDELEFETFDGPRQGLRYDDVRAEKTRRREEAEKNKREAEWARCIALVHEGDMLIDDGEPSKRGQFGIIPGRPAHVYYNVKITKGWPDDAEHANVFGEGSYGTQHNAGGLSYVADYIASGRLRVASKDEVPPRPVVERIGHEQRANIKRVEVDGRIVWVGRPLFGSEPLVLDDKGHLVRAKRIVVEATAFYYRSI